MSELAAQPEVAKNDGEVHTAPVTPETTAAPSISLDEALQKLAQLEKTNQRILSESKENKAKERAAKEKLDQLEMDKLTKDKDHEKIAQMLKDQLETERQASNAFKKKSMAKFLEAHVQKIAPDAQDPKLIIQSLTADQVNAVEEDGEIKFSGVSEQVDGMRKNSPFLFKPNYIPHMVNGKPAANAKATSPLSKLSELKTSEDVKAFWKANPHIK